MKRPKERKQKGRHDSTGPCDQCGWDKDRFDQCTNPECHGEQT